MVRSFGSSLIGGGSFGRGSGSGLEEEESGGNRGGTLTHWVLSVVKWVYRGRQSVKRIKRLICDPPTDGPWDAK